MNRGGVEAKLGDDMTPEAGLLRRFDLVGERAVWSDHATDSRMAFRVARDADLVDAVTLQQPALDQFERAGKRSCWPVAVAGDHEHAPHAGPRLQPRQQVVEHGGAGDMSRAARCGTGSKPAARTRTAASTRFATRTARHRL